MPKSLLFFTRCLCLFLYPTACLLLLCGCERNQVQPSQTDSRIQQIFSPAMLGADRAYLEKFTGVARNTNTHINQRTYLVGGCEVEVSFSGESITVLGMHVNEQCTFDLSAFTPEKQPLPVYKLTFGEFDRIMGSMTMYYADCLQSCGNAYDPSTYDHWAGPRSTQFMEMMVSTIEGPSYEWGEFMSKQMTEDWVINNQFNCDPERYTEKARDLFSATPIQKIEIGYDLLERHNLKDTCSLPVSQNENRAHDSYRIDVGIHGEFSITSNEDNLKIDDIFVNGFNCNVYYAGSRKQVGDKSIILQKNQTMAFKVDINQDCIWIHTFHILSNGLDLDGQLVDNYGHYVQSLNLKLGEHVAIEVAVTDSTDGYVNIRTKPNGKSPIAISVPNNTFFKVMGNVGNWLWVTSIDEGKITGYVHTSQVYVRAYHRP